ncbi:MAG: trypsin-like peptidase domain-containing protein [Defluviitaleaceae bacterium]|nr:trypsin-like peptidase domain-containing protein [Defluviitaleaceae bacterium]
MKKFVLSLTMLLIVFVFAACGGSGSSSEPANTPEPEPIHTPPAEVVEQPVVPVVPVELTPAQIFENNKYAVFQIDSRCVDGYWWFGSGFFIDSTGVAVTNHHVMVDMVEAWAILYDGREFEITGFFSYDIGNDLAVIQVGDGSEEFSYVVLGDSDAARVGEPVFAVGGPEGDPITFTAGMISRRANEPVSFGIYTIEGMLQSTAAIYGGNSGGPLLNDRGHVIGINSATRPDRASAQWAVPSNRISRPTSNSAVNPLPIDGARAGGTRVHVAGQIRPMTMFGYEFHFIPDFSSISRNAVLLMSGTPADLGEAPGSMYYDYYEYLVIFHLPEAHWIPDTDMFDIALMERGFVFQNIVHWAETWVYFFHPGYNVSVSYAFYWNYDLLLVGVVYGDIYYEFYHAGQVQIPDRLFLDPSLIGVWEFWDSTSELYLSWMNAGEYLFYVFEEDGTGQFATLNAAGAIVREFNFYWGTYNFELFIEYTDIDLLLVYFYEYDMQYGALYLASVTDEHLLILVYG